MLRPRQRPVAVAPDDEGQDRMSVLDRFRLDDKVALVTGASSGLGVAFAIALAEAGADVALGARRVERLQETKAAVEALGRRAYAARLDVTDPDGCRRFCADAFEALGRLDVLVNNAGVGTAVPASRETPEQFREVVEVNLEGVYWMAQAAQPHMTDGGAIVNIGSVLAETTAGLPQAAYSATKAGLIGLTRDLAQQWTGRKGIRVTCLEPGFFRTEMSDQYPEGYMETMMGRVPIGRPGELEECAAALVFLASDAASYVTGTTLAVDGGILTS